MKKPKNKNRLDKINFKLVLLVAGIIFIFLLNKGLFVFGLLTIVSAVFCYYHDMMNKTVFDFRLNFIVGIFITRHYGILYTLGYYVLSNVIPSLLAGGRIDGPTIIFYLEYFALFASVLFFPATNIILLALLLVMLDGILGVMINSALGVPPFMSMMAGLVAVSMRTVYVLTIGRLIETIFSII